MMGLQRRVFPQVISFLCCSPLLSELQGLLLHRGNSQKTEHLKVIKNKVLNPSRTHDIQSVGRTWLLADKTLSSSNSCSCIVALVGGGWTRRHFRWLSNPFSASQYWVSFWQGQREIFSLCSGSDSDCVHSSLRSWYWVCFRSFF